MQEKAKFCKPRMTLPSNMFRGYDICKIQIKVVRKSIIGIVWPNIMVIQKLFLLSSSFENFLYIPHTRHRNEPQSYKIKFYN